LRGAAGPVTSAPRMTQARNIFRHS
jgi:hypothetical protein